MVLLLNKKAGRATGFDGEGRVCVSMLVILM